MSEQNIVLIAQNNFDLVHGCTKVSSGCKNCYAEQLLGEKFNTVVVEEDYLINLPKWRSGAVVTIAECGDLFHTVVSDHIIMRTFDMIKDHQKQIFIVLTKRTQRLSEMFSNIDLPKNLVLGVSAENQETADERILALEHIKGAIKFVSAQPLLGPIVLPNIQFDWLCVGGEWGSNARMIEDDWVRSLRDQCKLRKIPMSYQQHTINGKREMYPRIDNERIKQRPPIGKNRS